MRRSKKSVKDKITDLKKVLTDGISSMNAARYGVELLDGYIIPGHHTDDTWIVVSAKDGTRTMTFKEFRAWHIQEGLGDVEDPGPYVPKPVPAYVAELAAMVQTTKRAAIDCVRTVFGVDRKAKESDEVNALIQLANEAPKDRLERPVEEIVENAFTKEETEEYFNVSRRGLIWPSYGRR